MIREILRHTPVWVFGLFALLVFLGLKQARSRTVSMPRLALLPLVMLGLSLYGVASAFGGSAASIGCWAAGMLLSTGAGRLLGPLRAVSYSPGAKAFEVPGSWLPLALMMAIFFTKYAVAVTLARDPALREVSTFVAATSALYGAYSGAFFARALRILGNVRPAAGFGS